MALDFLESILILIVKSFISKDGDGQKISFKIRKQKVLDALHWLKKYNTEYQHIEIAEQNLYWMQGNEDILPNKNVIQIECSDNTNNVFEKIQHEAYENQTETDPSVYGYINSPPTENTPQKKDRKTTIALQESVSRVNKSTSIDFPFVSETPIDEYDTTNKLFCKAFPWLYPGGIGDFHDYSEEDEEIDQWMARLLYYFDGRFARDKMWCFFALNFSVRHKNATSGSYFVQDFYKDSPKTLTELQDSIENGNFDWINRIQYFSYKVKGSSGYWRFKRSEVYSWINHHVASGSGPPTLFITLSCAEYHWPDIKRLIVQRNKLFGRNFDPSNSTEFIKEVNDLTMVVQEYFQNRVNAWLQSVGRHVLGIKHHWLRYEFAPGRGQIHAPMLAITNHMNVHSHYYYLGQGTDKEASRTRQAEYLASWVENTFQMTASVHPQLLQAVSARNSKDNHPSSKYYTEIQNHEFDDAQCLWTLQRHKCSEKCLQARRYRYEFASLNLGIPGKTRFLKNIVLFE